MVKGLLVEIKDWRTGERAGDIDIRNLPANSLVVYQDLEGNKEIIVVPDTYAEKFKGVEGVEVLEGKQILDAIYELVKPRYRIIPGREAIFNISLQKKVEQNPDVLTALEEIPGEFGDDDLEFLYYIKVLGIRKIIPYEDRIKMLLDTMEVNGMITKEEKEEFLKKLKDKKKSHPKTIEWLKKFGVI